MKTDIETISAYHKDKINQPESNKLYQKKFQNEKKLHMIVIAHNLDV